jgi:dTMP kinase
MPNAGQPASSLADGPRVRGALIAIEGPNGVGKTTLAGSLTTELRARSGRYVHSTTQPSRTRLGRFLRESEDDLSGRAYALALAADRYDQEVHEIRPHLDAGCQVVIDRYVHSSLVLQRLDGLPLAEIWSYNQYIRAPDVTIWLDHDPHTIGQRLDQRGQRSRLELAGSPALEAQHYAEACEFLAGQGWTHHRIDARGLTPDEVLASSLRYVE